MTRTVFSTKKLINPKLFDGVCSEGDSPGAGNGYGDGCGDHDNEEERTTIWHHFCDGYQLSFGEVSNEAG